MHILPEMFEKRIHDIVTCKDNLKEIVNAVARTSPSNEVSEELNQLFPL